MGVSKPGDRGLQGYKNSRSKGSDRREASAAIVQATVPQWLNVTFMLGLIFGGCCANVLALEALIREIPNCGTLITFTQFLLTALFTLPNYVSLSRGVRNFYLKERAIPFQKWLIYTAFFLTINLLNNKAFGYKISLPLHVILRSAGPVTSMFVGFLYGKRYSKTQILAVFLLFIGVVTAAFADAQAKNPNISLFGDSSGTSAASGGGKNTSTTGFVLLFLALLLSAIMGVFTDRTYARYGRNHWGETLFYSHILSLPIFLYQYSDLRNEFSNMLSSPPLSLYVVPADTLPPFLPPNITESPIWSQLPIILPPQLIKVPSQIIFLLINALTQYLCIRGVNLLSAKSSSLSVTIVLNVRKLVSLILSIWLFGNNLPHGVLLGAAIVFAGAGLYAKPSGKKKQVEPKEVDKDANGNTGHSNGVAVSTDKAKGKKRQGYKRA